MALKLNDNSPLVKKWQQFLKEQGFLAAQPNGNFGPKTFEATKAFQKFHSMQATGVADSLTLGKAFGLGFNLDSESRLPQINSNQKMMRWIKDNLGSIINQAIAGSIYTEDWLAGICARETGFLFTRHANNGRSFEEICPLMKGDFGKRKGEAQKIFHGFGFWQIDIGSFPDFVNSGKWKDPLETARMAVSVLNGKKRFLKQKGWEQKLTPVMWERAITAAYNCGEGNVNKALTNGLDVDRFTFAKDYSKEVFRYRDIYSAL
ncbi:MAG TPA: peptidoglycan-binding protein [Chitinophagaceae bacterium]|nr:peptidoglycan-binding protein [Chitinophagaceae bacterium]